MHYRKKLKLGNYGRYSSYLPIVALPAIMSTLFHNDLVLPAIILEQEKCSLCVQTRSAVIHTGFSIILPSLLAPLSGFMFATRHFTYRLPSITEKPMEVLKLYIKLTKPITNSLLIIAGANALFAMYLAYKQMETVCFVKSKLLEFDSKYENN